MSLTLRPARPGDAEVIFAFVRELAEYEHLSHQVESSAADIDAALFGANPNTFADIAEWAGEPIGFALWFLNFSTFRGRNGVYLEDLFVRPAFRGRGVGKSILAYLARKCVDNGWSRLEWSVLDWNAPAIGFYQAQGATVLPDWRICRVTGEALSDLARAE